MAAYEYRRATWDEVPTLGRQGWHLVPIPPIQEMRQVLGQPQVSEPLYTMEREAGPDSGAAPAPGPLARILTTAPK